MDSLLTDLPGEWVATAALIVLVVLLRQLSARFIRQSGVDADARRRWLVQVRTGAILTLVFGLAVIWAQELRTVALSLVAVAVALTIATKELLLGLSGALVRTSSRSFSIGDRIQVGTFRGDVIDVGALTTQVLEVDDVTNRRTGRAITVPNSMFLDKPVVNETFAGSYVLNVLNVPLAKGVDWRKNEAILLDVAREECASFMDEAIRQIEKASVQRGLDTPIVEPTVSLVLEKPGEVTLAIRFPTPVRMSNRVAQAILRRYLERTPSVSEESGALEDSLEQ